MAALERAAIPVIVLRTAYLAAVDADPVRVRGLLKELVPEYNPPEPSYSLGPAMPALPIDAVRGV